MLALGSCSVLLATTAVLFRALQLVRNRNENVERSERSKGIDYDEKVACRDRDPRYLRKSFPGRPIVVFAVSVFSLQTISVRMLDV